jgi:S1-C subfamily serine protease
MVRNTGSTTRNSVISLVCGALLALPAISILVWLTPLQVSAQSNATGNSQLANNNASTVVGEGKLNSRDLTFRDLFSKVNSSIVQITSSGIPASSLPETLPGGGNDSQRLLTAIGSGFVIDKAGHVATNNHVIANAQNVSVAFSDGSYYPAMVVGADPFADTAVLQLQNVPAGKLIPLPLGNSSELAVGDQVVAIGNPFGLTGSMSTGVVSGLGRLLPETSPPPSNSTNNTAINYAFSIPDIIQTDAAINPGNSGGPLLNLKGEVIGMNTAIFSVSPFAVSSGVGFAIPSDTLKVILPSLISRGYYVHPWMGLSGTNVTPEIALKLGLNESKGFLVTDIVKGGPADKAGLRGGDMPVDIGGTAGFQGGPQSNLLRLGGDIILRIDNQTVAKIDDLLSYVETKKKAGDTVTLTVLRDGQMIPIDIVLSARPYQVGK